MMKHSFILILWLITAAAGQAYHSDISLERKTAPGSSSPVKNKAETEIEASVLTSAYTSISSAGYDTFSNDSYPIQVGAFKIRLNAEALYNKIVENTDIEAKIVSEDGFYKVRIARVPPDKEISNLNPGERPVILKVATPDTLKTDTTTSAGPQSMPVDSILSDTTGNAARSDTVGSILTNTVKAADKLASAAKGIFIIRGESPWLKRINYFGKSLVFVNALILAIIISIASRVTLLSGISFVSVVGLRENSRSISISD
jgi:hypothetical protein